MKSRDCRDYLQDILDSISEIGSFIKGSSAARFPVDAEMVWKAASERIPALKGPIQKLLKELNKS